MPVSIHAPLARGDLSCAVIGVPHIRFQSTPLLRGATRADIVPEKPFEFQSTPLLRGATFLLNTLDEPLRVSIHAPLARGDTRPTKP